MVCSSLVVFSLPVCRHSCIHLSPAGPHRPVGSLSHSLWGAEIWPAPAYNGPRRYIQESVDCLTSCYQRDDQHVHVCVHWCNSLISLWSPLSLQEACEVCCGCFVSRLTAAIQEQNGRLPGARCCGDCCALIRNNALHMCPLLPSWLTACVSQSCPRPRPVYLLLCGAVLLCPARGRAGGGDPSSLFWAVVSFCASISRSVDKRAVQCCSEKVSGGTCNGPSPFGALLKDVWKLI